MAAVLVAGAVGCTQTAKHISSAGSPGSSAASGQPPPCSPNPPPEAPPAKPTTVTTIGQAYYCVFAHYYAGPVLDDRVLLAGAFAGFTQELDRLGIDQPDATMPALTGHRDTDWAAFAAVYQKVTSQLPASPAQRQELAAATMTGMIAGLDNNHARWSYPAPPPGDVPGDLGIMTSPAPPLADIAPHEALPPLFITAVLPGSPAASNGLRPGDIIVSVDGAPPFPDGIISAGVMNLLFGPYPPPGRVSVQLHRPATGRTWTVTLTPALYQAPPPPLLHLTLVVLTDRNCASGCDAFSVAVKDLRLGTLVGTRTSGIVAAPAAAYLLDDASLIVLPATQELSARHELINDIGVAPDYYLPLTAQDLSTGHDPDIAKALTLLGG